jgi:hypothetical protein
MSDVLKKWLADRVNVPGTLGGGIHLPDGSCVCQSVDDQFTADRIEKLLQRVAQFQTQLSDPSQSLQWSTWGFEQGKLRCVVRPDGWLLGIAVRNETDAAKMLNKLSKEFLALELPV